MGLDRAVDWTVDDQRLFARVEDASLNASAAPQQLWTDGWLLRFSPGKAKRARCVHALAPGREPLASRLEVTERFYARQGLPLIFRITPFTQPPEVDAVLAARGFESVDDTRVMVCREPARWIANSPGAAAIAGHTVQSVGTHAFALAVGAMRGSSIAQQQAHAQRLEQSPLTWSAFVVRRDADGRVVASGQVAVENDLVGLYDVHTEAPSRRRGLAAWLVVHALSWAIVKEGAQVAYLQVDADNVAARALYARLGFADAYRYHYRLRPGSNPGGLS